MSLRSNRKPALYQWSTFIKHATLMSYKLEPAIWSCNMGQRITWLDRCQLIITRCNIPKKYKVNQGCMSLSTYYLEYDRHLARLHHRCCHRRCAYAPTSTTVSHDHHEKINSWVSFSFLWVQGSAWWHFRPPELRYKAHQKSSWFHIKYIKHLEICFKDMTSQACLP